LSSKIAPGGSSIGYLSQREMVRLKTAVSTTSAEGTAFRPSKQVAERHSGSI